MPRLILLRHATAASGRDDAARALTDHGRQEAHWVGASLQRQGWLPDLALCSTAVRASQTFDGLVAGTGGSLDPACARLDTRLYLAAPERLMGCIAEVEDEAGTLLVVAHNPGIFDLAQALAERNAEGRLALSRGFPPASLARYAVVGSWASLAPAAATLVDVLRPG
ncbi:MAG: histidine phosphatase family protein [Myxococcales bacterium]|nr:histidine phosphatase family protein [Myxococcales bacterium]MDD9965706.1 histidine phosphatase family protein [Myxococcales bacterium]